MDGLIVKTTETCIMCQLKMNKTQPEHRSSLYIKATEVGSHPMSAGQVAQYYLLRTKRHKQETNTKDKSKPKTSFSAIVM